MEQHEETFKINPYMKEQAFKVYPKQMFVKREADEILEKMKTLTFIPRAA